MYAVQYMRIHSSPVNTANTLSIAMSQLGRSQTFTSTWLHGWHLALPCVLMAKMTIITTNRAHSLEQMGNGLARRGMGDNHARHKGAGCQ